MTMAVDKRTRREQLEPAAAADIAAKLASILRTYEDVDELFAPNAFFDINVPFWRMPLQGAGAFIAWLRGFAPHGYDITVVRALPTASGLAVEVEGEYDDPDGHQFFRNLYLCDIADGRVTATSFWCTGDWDGQRRARYLAHASKPDRKQVST